MLRGCVPAYTARCRAPGHAPPVIFDDSGATRPGDRTRGVLLAGPLAIPVVLGRSGILANKREGDGATPRGRFRLVRLWWRADRCRGRATLLPARRITPDLAWCEDTADRRYNRPFRRSANEPGDRLWRDDHLYDLIIEIDHNTRPRVAGRGSAVFVQWPAEPVADGGVRGAAALRGLTGCSEPCRSTSVETAKHAIDSMTCADPRAA